MAYPTRKIGKDNVPVSAIGFGAMGISSYYGDTDPDEERFKVGIDHQHQAALCTLHITHPDRCHA